MLHLNVWWVGRRTLLLFKMLGNFISLAEILLLGISQIIIFGPFLPGKLPVPVAILEGMHICWHDLSVCSCLKNYARGGLVTQKTWIQSYNLTCTKQQDFNHCGNVHYLEHHVFTVVWNRHGNIPGQCQRTTWQTALHIKSILWSYAETAASGVHVVG